MSSTSQLSSEYQKTLLEVARQSIRHGLEAGSPLPINLIDYPDELIQQRATFVTLKISKQLRGCIGTLEAHRPLVEDISWNAFSAAFKDPRFPPITEPEIGNLDIHLSLLTAPEPIEFDSQQDLLSKIRPSVDGLILQDGKHRGTFLPSVWESLPNPESFLEHLKMKAGLPESYWSDTIKVYRYTAESVEQSGEDQICC